VADDERKVTPDRRDTIHMDISSMMVRAERELYDCIDGDSGEWREGAASEVTLDMLSEACDLLAEAGRMLTEMRRKDRQ